ncbi:c4db6342-98d9-4f5f-bfa1-2fc39a2a0af0 [Sclerotinia trifoliorum]|uniref:Cytochrome c oxidase assembly protein COX16, mitochondrial n=1 Tax=Sclerotinia trifoliorum TaxID=28548 RepID=A0A8H2VSD6_9HELO|nr:c4db6342-98d9-4f5f-bfa1-2fc39a2a0af0 [Sclerotinia trifoliorum]
MAVFGSKKFRGAAHSNTFAAKYRSALAKHPFALFGLPFILTMVAGSFFLTPATAVRYEKHDKRVKRLSKDEELGIGKTGRRVDMKEEYYRLAAKDLDDWEQKRVKRLPGEHDGKI